MSGIFDGRVALVTGGSGGLGRHICATLARQGASVAIGYKSGQTRVEALRDGLRSEGHAIVTEQVDLTDVDSVEDCVTSVGEWYGRIDILVNASGTVAAPSAQGQHITPGDLDALTPAIWDELMAVNLRGPYIVARSAARYLRRAGPGRIVNVGSTVGLSAWGAEAHYAPSMASVVPLTRFLSASLAPDVLVNCVAPGLIEGTRMSSAAQEGHIAAWRDRAVLERTTSLAEVAALVIQCCRATSMTGQTITVDGGIHFG